MRHALEKHARADQSLSHPHPMRQAAARAERPATCLLPNGAQLMVGVENGHMSRALAPGNGPGNKLLGACDGFLEGPPQGEMRRDGG